MRRIAAYLLALVLPFAAAAQDGGFLEGLIEDSLSGAGREVVVTGFTGALSAQASLDSLTIADETGIWLSLRGVTLDWSRAALLRGRLEVTRLAALEIELSRLPEAQASAPSPEASGFALPELPVSIEIGALEVGRLALGAPVLGQAMTLRLEGAVQLAGGEGSARLLANRIDDAQGLFDLDAGYANDTQQLRLNLLVEEGPAGIIATLADLPGAPALRLEVQGDAPAPEFAADLVLDTDGARRLAGRVALVPGEDRQGFSAQLGGDVAPLFAPDYREFFGEAIALDVQGAQFPDGRLELDRLELVARQIAIAGQIAIADGMPSRIDITGRIAGEGPVVLPLAGPVTQIASADLAVQFDAATSDTWTGRFDIRDFSRDGIEAAQLVLDGSGRIVPGAVSAVTAAFDFAARALDLGDPAAQVALGEEVSGRAELDWRADGPLNLSRLEVSGETYALRGSAQVEGAGRDLAVRAQAEVEARDLAVFSGLAGRTLGGAASGALELSGQVLGGAFTAGFDGRTQDLRVDQPQADALLDGAGLVVLRAGRGADGLVIEDLRIATDHARITGQGRIATGDSDVGLRAELPRVGLVLEGASGPFGLTLAAREDAQGWDVTARAEGLVVLETQARITGLSDVAEVAGELALQVPDLAQFATLAGRPLAGALDLTVAGRSTVDAERVDVLADLGATGLRSGIAPLDRILAGGATLRLDGAREAGVITLRGFQARTALLQVEASGDLSRASSDLVLDARLADIAPFVEGLSGPFTVTGRAQRGREDWDVDLTAAGPGNIRAAIAGGIAEYGDRVDLSIDGSAPLALANAFIAPRAVSGNLTFDLRADGAPALAAVSGRLGLTGGRLVAPALGLVIEDLGLDATLGQSRAQIDLSGRSQEGGGVRITGPIALDAPNTADLTIRLDAFGLRDPRLYDSSISGEVTIAGPLTGGARIGGALSLGVTELRVPSTGLGGTDPIPDLRHVGETAPIRTTRDRAGLIEAAGNGGEGGGGGRAYPLDLRIVADNRIFLRGRGLDAELAGALRIGGTSRAVIPEGQFSLVRGRLDILGKRLDLDEGSVSLEGDFDPVIRLVAVTQAEDVTVRIVIDGQASEPQISFLSEPELPEDEVLARLLFGRGIDTLSPLQAAQLANAVATLAGRGGNGIIANLRQGFGLDDLDVASTEDGTAALRAGKYLSENVYTDVTIDTQGQTEINLNLDLSPSVTVKGSVDNSGETGLGIFFERDY